jgi:hypothetical protein
MRNFMLRLTMLAGAMLTLGSCADSPTGSDRQQRTADVPPGAPVHNTQVVQGCVLEGLCILDPVSPAPCDPWESLRWCDGEGDGDNCMTSVFDSSDLTVQSCPGDDGGMPGGGGAPPPPPGDGTTCPVDEAPTTCPVPPDSAACEADCPPPEEEVDSDICPEPLDGRTLTYLVGIAGRNHEFKFTGRMNRVNPLVGRSPAWYKISGPTASKDTWWIAESGNIQLVCWGGWRFRNTVWVGTVVVQDDDLHMVMGPGHPDF